MAFLILLFTLTALLYIIPIIIFLPFHMSFLQEIGLFFYNCSRTFAYCFYYR